MASIVTFNIIKENQGPEQNQRVLANNKSAKPIMFYNATTNSLTDELMGNKELKDTLKQLNIFNLDCYTNTSIYGMVYDIATDESNEEVILIQDLYPLTNIPEGAALAKDFISYVVQNNQKIRTRQDLENELNERSRLTKTNIQFVLNQY